MFRKDVASGDEKIGNIGNTWSEFISLSKHKVCTRERALAQSFIYPKSPRFYLHNIQANCNFSHRNMSNSNLYDDIKITPFNLNEELEEGRFDEAGNYLSDRTKKDDKWADSIDWDAIERKQKDSNNTQIPHASKDQQSETYETPLSEFECYKQMLRIMKYNETVQKCIKRLGDAVPKRRFNRGRTSKQGHPMDVEDSEQVSNAKFNLDRMIELAHQRLENGDMDIYQKSYEDIEGAIN